MRLLETLTKLLRPSPQPDTDWQWEETLKGPVMERWQNGKRERRPMTKEEEAVYMTTRSGW